MSIDLLIKGKKIFEDCLYFFEEFKLSEEFITAIAKEEIESKRSEAEKLMISAFGFGYVLGLATNTDSLHRELDKVEDNKEALGLLLHISELKRKMREIGLFPRELS